MGSSFLFDVQFSLKQREGTPNERTELRYDAGLPNAAADQNASESCWKRKNANLRSAIAEEWRRIRFRFEIRIRSRRLFESNLE